jgi:hypothetical protein
MQLHIIGCISLSFYGSMGGMDDGVDSLSLFEGAEDRDIEESSGGLETIEKSRGEVRVFVAATSETWMSELAEDCVLAAHEVDGVVDIFLEFFWLGDGGVDLRLFVKGSFP